MPNQYHIAENLRDYELPVDLRDLVNTVISGIMTLATRAANSNTDSNSVGGTSLTPNLRTFPVAFYSRRANASYMLLHVYELLMEVG